MIDFINNIKKYFSYSIYSAKSKLKVEVAGSYLNSLWWIINPLCFMLIYMFIVEVVFKSSEDYFPVFVFIGLMIWDYFNKMVSSSIKCISDNKNIVSKVYIPKYILLIIRSFVLLFKLFISLMLIIILMIIFKIDITFKILYFIPILIVLYTLTFGISTIMMHFGVYIEDLYNVVNILLKLVFYFSGIFYNIVTKVPNPYNNILLLFNPVAFLINETRNVFMYNISPNIFLLMIWFLVGIIFSIIGLKLIKQYENGYVKVIQ